MHTNFISLLLSLTIFRFSNSQNNQYSTTTKDLYREESATTPIADYEDVNAKPKKKEILDTVLHENNYDSTIRPPGINGSGPVEVVIGNVM